MLVDRFAVDEDAIRVQFAKAIPALQKYAESKQAKLAEETGAVDLLPEPESVTLSFSLNKIPIRKDFRFHTVAVPHPIVDVENKSLCLLARDPKDKATAAVAAHKLPIEKIITVKSLKRKYASQEARKELANRFDAFFCEMSIYEMMGKLLGKYFFETKKQKIPMPMKVLGSESFERALRTARFRVRGGSVVGVRVGHRGMPAEQLVENAMAVVKFIATKYCCDKKTYNNVSNIAIGATNVIDLPIWSVPVVEAAEPVVAAVAVETPKAKQAKDAKEAKEAKVAQDASVDLAEVPLKKLKQVQQARVDQAKAALGSNENAKKKQRK